MIMNQLKQTGQFHLEIPVNDAVLVTMVDALQNLLDAVRRIGFAVEFAGNDVLEEFAARHTGEKSARKGKGKKIIISTAIDLHF